VNVGYFVQGAESLVTDSSFRFGADTGKDVLFVKRKRKARKRLVRFSWFLGVFLNFLPKLNCLN